MDNLLRAFQLGINDRRQNKFVHYLRSLTTLEHLEYARGWISEWQEEKELADESKPQGMDIQETN